ncbi:MAG: carbamoyltransferase HypF [Campylobacter sp.]|nr:carbamoyltransferase HypF [Campylobacter sp.]
MKTYKFEIFGIVQGVGFRPFIYSLAQKCGVKGEVFNDSQGVKIIANLNDPVKFKDEILSHLPPLARVDEIKFIQVQSQNFTEFSITKSKNSLKQNPLLPDFAICDECKKEFYDPQNPRYHYPFINCTNCGPRLSIIKTLPYDRTNTTMDKFKMCEFCLGEYQNPTNRRFHAEPVSCKSCGPSLLFKTNSGELLAKNKDAIIECIKAIKDGKIVAIKGLGGFHLVCDATNANAVSTLRVRKNRPDKPFAIMCKDSKMASKFAEISKAEDELLNSNIKPIVLLKLKNFLVLPSNLAPNLSSIGIFLPPTGLHLLLFEYIDFPLIATSANISGEPIIYDEKTLLSKLSKVIDFYLDNDREILTPSDDSIAFIIENNLTDKNAMFLRNSRGVAPKIYRSNFKEKDTFLALGAELKNEFAIYKDAQIYKSPYIGNLKNLATQQRFQKMLDMFCEIYDIKFDAVIGDLHPSFWNTNEFAKICKTSQIPLFKVQHHYAHLLSGLMQNSLLNSGKEFLGFCFDGTGYGDDGKIWGGEVMVFDEFNYERKYHFDEFKLIGGDNAIKNPKFLHFAITQKYQISNDFDYKSLNLAKAYAKTTLFTSSLGRIFDAFGVEILGDIKPTYEAQIPMMLDKFYDENISENYEFSIKNGVIIYKNAFLPSKENKKTKVSKFVNSIASIMLEIALLEQKDVILGGGVFANRALLTKCLRLFKQNSIKCYISNPTNDSSIALGELAWYICNKR